MNTFKQLSNAISLILLYSMETSQVKLTTFKVDDVEVQIPFRVTKHASIPSLFAKRGSPDDNVRVEAFSSDDFDLENTIRLGTSSHGFFLACLRAYSNHMNLSLSPDDFKLIILQGLSQHINQNSEKFRDNFVDHSGQKHINLDRDDFVMGVKDNDWGKLFSDFADKIDEDLKDKKLVQLIQSPMSTSTPTTMASFNISLMDAMQTYFSYGFTTCCGIPSITLSGTLEDWKSLIELVTHISQYDLEWWTNQIIPILKECCDTVNDPQNRDVKFWSNIINEGGGSGGPYYSGWVCKLFPYLGKREIRKNEFNYKSNFGGGIPLSDIPSGISQVPVEWDYHACKHSMIFTSGFYGHLYDTQTHTIKPEISWLVYEKL